MTGIGDVMAKRVVSEEEDLGRILFEHMLDGLIASGDIDPRKKTRDQVHREAAALITCRFRDEAPLLFAIDYRDDLLANARVFRRKNSLGISCVLYATWMEHLINGIVVIKLTREGRFSALSVLEVIRSVNPAGKLTWLLPLVGLPRLSEGHTAVLKELVELRNSFVHYKWRMVPLDDNKEHIRLGRLLSKIERTVRYLKRYERRNAYHGFPSAARRRR